MTPRPAHSLRWLDTLLGVGAAGAFYFDDRLAAVAVALGAAAVAARAGRRPIWRFLTLSCCFTAAVAVERGMVPRHARSVFPAAIAVTTCSALVLREELREALGPTAWRRAPWLVPLVAAAAIVAMHLWFERHPPGRLARPLWRQPDWLLCSAMPPAVLANALGEELTFRGGLLSALRRSLGAPAAVAIQALAFGLWHWHGGLPHGPVGCLMACAFGAALGAARIAARSLWPCVAAHAAAGLYVGWTVVEHNTVPGRPLWPLAVGLGAALALFLGLSLGLPRLLHAHRAT